MKKLFFAALMALMPSALVSAQDFSIAGRVDYPWDYNIYTFLDGEIGEHVAYSFSNHWVSKETKMLYQNTWRAWESNWCDWANFTFTFGNLAITAGKDMMLTGSNEESPNDIDNYSFLCSEFWNCLQVYQWGGKLAYDFEAAKTIFEVQFCSSPFDEKPFSKHGVLSFGIKGDYSFYHPYLTANFMKYDFSEYFDDPAIPVNESFAILTFGNLFNVTDSFDIAFDYVHCTNKPLSTSNHFVLGADWSISDHFALKGKAGYEFSRGEAENILGIPENNWFAGLCFQYFPLNNEDLRIHAAGGYRQNSNTYFDLGITYNFNITNLFRK